MSGRPTLTLYFEINIFELLWHHLGLSAAYPPMSSFLQCCGTVTIYYGSGSGSGSDFWKVMVPVPVPVPTFEKLWFRFRFEKVTVPVPVPAPYLDHKKLIFLKKKFGKFLDFLLLSCFTRKKFMNSNKFMVKCEWKNFFMKEIKYIILWLVPVPEP